MGANPSETHILYPNSMSLHAVQAQVLPLFHFSISSTEIPYFVANAEHVSPFWIRWAAQTPSALGFGATTPAEGKLPAEQQTKSPPLRVEHRFVLGLYLTKFGLLIPHFLTSEGHVSPSETVT
jgi:hypothetical protein